MQNGVTTHGVEISYNMIVYLNTGFRERKDMIDPTYSTTWMDHIIIIVLKTNDSKSLGGM